MSNKNRNRTAGHNWERESRNIFRNIGFTNCETSRYASRKMDDLKVDLVETGPFYVQCKLSNSKLDYSAILESMPKSKNHINIILAKLTKKVNSKFITKDKLVVMKLDDFINLLIDNNLNDSIN